VEEVIFH